MQKSDTIIIQSTLKRTQLISNWYDNRYFAQFACIDSALIVIIILWIFWQIKSTNYFMIFYRLPSHFKIILLMYIPFL